MRNQKRQAPLNFLSQVQDKIGAEVQQYAINYTPQIFYEKDGIPYPTGSSVLISIDDHYFLVTAAHVIEDDKDYFLRMGSYTMDLQRSYFKRMTSALPDKVTSDKIDIAIAQMDQAAAAQIKAQGMDFIRKTKLTGLSLRTTWQCSIWWVIRPPKHGGKERK